VSVRFSLNKYGWWKNQEKYQAEEGEILKDEVLEKLIERKIMAEYAFFLQAAQ
jgi:hypothetical protein